MTTYELIQNGKITISELIDFMEGVGAYKEVQKTLNKETGFENAKIDLDAPYTNSDLSNASIIEVDVFY